MRKVEVLRKGILAGILLEESNRSFVFIYDENYLNSNQPAISLTLPKSRKEYRSEFLFPYFYNMLSEGANKKLQSRQLRIDENDDFGLLMATAQNDVIGAVTVQPIV